MKLIPYTPLTGHEILAIRVLLPLMAAALAIREPRRAK